MEQKAPNRLACLDLDGCLIDSRELHYRALNQALEAHGYPPIPRDLHLSIYDGLPTSTKLELLKVPMKHRTSIWKRKQDATLVGIEALGRDQQLVDLVDKLGREGIAMAVVSNAVRKTTNAALEAIGLGGIGLVLTADIDGPPKPSPHMFWKAMDMAGATAKTTVILEDGHIGREAAIASGATLLPVSSRADLDFDRIMAAFGNGKEPVKYRNPEMNVVIPMAGEGARFQAAGYSFPKPLIEVNGKPMIQVVVENLNLEAHFIFVVRDEDCEKYQLGYLLPLIAPGCEIVVREPQPDNQKGAALTVLAAQHLIDNRKPLLVANSDQYLEWDSNETLHAFAHPDLTGGVVTFQSTHPKWSYAKLDDMGFVAEIAEKKPISTHATCGIYYWSHGADFVRHAWAMVAAGDRTLGEFYLAPILNYTIKSGGKIRVKEAKRMWGLGTPEDLRYFMDNYKCQT